MTDIRERYDRALTDLYGLGTALVTPFKEDLSVDYEALDRLLDIQLSGDTDYIVVLGTTGEAATLTDEEKTAFMTTESEDFKSV